VLRAGREKDEHDRLPVDVAGDSGLPPGPHEPP
jgi:hypothetical protein